MTTPTASVSPRALRFFFGFLTAADLFDRADLINRMEFFDRAGSIEALVRVDAKLLSSLRLAFSSSPSPPPQNETERMGCRLNGVSWRRIKTVSLSWNPRAQWSHRWSSSAREKL